MGDPQIQEASLEFTYPFSPPFNDQHWFLQKIVFLFIDVKQGVDNKQFWMRSANEPGWEGRRLLCSVNSQFPELK